MIPIPGARARAPFPYVGLATAIVLLHAILVAVVPPNPYRAVFALAAFVLVIVFFAFFATWVQARMAGAPVSVLNLVSMKLRRVPINLAVRIGGDEGRPVVVDHPELPESQSLVRIAQNVADRVAISNLKAVPRGHKPLVQLGKRD